MENNEVYKTFMVNGRVYEIDEPADRIVGEIVEPIKEIVTVKKNNITYISYGEKSTGKSTILGTLPTFSELTDNVCFYTLVTLFHQIEIDRGMNKASSLRITAFEIFVDELIDCSTEE